VGPEDYIRETLQGPGGTFGEFDYANGDHVLLGLIVTRLDGEPWAASIERRILAPLGMDDTGLLDMTGPPGVRPS
jgi:CubicO group peptidase (beta-lactamase class C family)